MYQYTISQVALGSSAIGGMKAAGQASKHEGMNLKQLTFVSAAGLQHCLCSASVMAPELTVLQAGKQGEFGEGKLGRMPGDGRGTIEVERLAPRRLWRES